MYRWDVEKGGHEAVWEVPNGVHIGESGLLFSGKYNLAMFYEADTTEAGFKFLQEIEPYAKVERYLTTPCDWCQNTKELQKELE
jgi:hypothetical protein